MGHDVVAVLGAGGTMGRPMARNLARAVLEVRAWNRTREKAEPLTADGVRVVDTAAEAADGAGIVITMLSDGDAVLATMEGDDGGLAHAEPTTIWVQASTVGIDATERCATLARERGVAFVDAPVLGTKQPAEAGELVVLASGPEELGERLRPAFEAVGGRTMWVGEAGRGTRLKLVANSWVLTVVGGTAEAVALAEGLDLDPALLLEAVAGGGLDLPYLRMKGKAIAEPAGSGGVTAAGVR